MSRIAILFENSVDQVTLVAHRMAELLRARGHSVEASDFRSRPRRYSPTDWREVRQFARDFEAALPVPKESDLLAPEEAVTQISAVPV
jgi:hypothetical protein